MSIVFYEATPSDERYLTSKLPGEDLHFEQSPISIANQVSDIAANAEIVSPFVHSHLSADVIESMTALKLIATRSTGYDHINIPAAESRAIKVSNVPTYGENTVAEHTFALILSLSRNVHKAYVRTTQGDFSLDGLQGFDLKGKTIGVIGTGHIGLHVIRMAQGFDMKVLAFDPQPNTGAADLLTFPYVSLDELLSSSDIVTLHAPLTTATHHLICAKTLAQFKRGALLINTARGGLVDTQALTDALDRGILAGAGLDVIEGEEVFSEEKQLLLNPESSEDSLRMALRNLSLIKRPDLVVTPHIAYDSSEAIERILDTTIANIKAFRAGAAINLVHS